MSDKAYSGPSRPATARPVAPTPFLLAMAASLLLVAVSWWLASRQWGTHTVEARTGVKSVGLPDGSTVHLRQGSRLKYPRRYGDTRR